MSRSTHGRRGSPAVCTAQFSTGTRSFDQDRQGGDHAFDLRWTKGLAVYIRRIFSIERSASLVRPPTLLFRLLISASRPS